MKNILPIILSLILVNCEKDDYQDDPIRATWLVEYDQDNSDGDTAYYQEAYKFNDEKLFKKVKFSINNIDTYVSSEEFTWKNNDPSCSPANCTNYNEAIQEYTINGEIENVVFSNPIETDYGETIYNRAIFGKVVMERQAEDIFWNNF
jgi:hypothetical protein